MKSKLPKQSIDYLKGKTSSHIIWSRKSSCKIRKSISSRRELKGRRMTALRLMSLMRRMCRRMRYARLSFSRCSCSSAPSSNSVSARATAQITQFETGSQIQPSSAMSVVQLLCISQKTQPSITIGWTTSSQTTCTIMRSSTANKNQSTDRMVYQATTF